MKTLYALTLASLIGLAASTAYADDASNVKPRPKAQAAAATAGTPAGAPVKISQQDKMRLCAKQATGKKGDERRTFMKTCLSKKA
jgi:hypothetical protein